MYFRTQVTDYQYDSDTTGILETGLDIIFNVSFLTGSWSKYLDSDKSVLQTLIIALNKRFEDIHTIRYRKAEMFLDISTERLK